MNLHNTPSPIITQGIDGGLYQVQRLPIGVWDMDTDISMTVAHNTSFDKIVHLSALIYNDAMNSMYNIEGYEVFGGAIKGSIIANATLIILIRLTGGYFDSIEFNDAVMNRGYIYLTKML